MYTMFEMKKLLHVGCGSSRLENTTKGFNDGAWSEIRFDINALNNPDIVGSMSDMNKVDTGSIDAIFSSHNIEHLYFHEAFVALTEFNRVLKEDGFCVITCPDLQAVCALVAEDLLLDAAYISPAGPIAPIDIIYGHRISLAQGNDYMAHRCGFTKQTLSTMLGNAGFRAVRTIRRPECFDLWALASKEYLSDSQLRALASNHFPET